ncbi:E3 ubiquitin-protein ligase CHFR-like [Acipenser ruthenus]|uniref:E3 ubiquitin-protein ligase CHFR-like n=1 Tax=Acipenser ruthenus TaxID=7906 RepID=UPI0027425396|nr:E3 ubiquitin-protein ligase CHFR-like [Acipenser ruthenus]
MQNQESSLAWGKLTRVGSETRSEILLVSKECTIGRKKGCDLSFPANKMVSSDHCKIVQDENSGEVWLEDMSTNGTVINKSKVVKKQTCQLQNGDVIYVVYRKNEPDQNVAYIYHSITAEQAHVQELKGEPCSEPLISSGMDPSVEKTPGIAAQSPKAIQLPSHEEPQPSTSTSELYSTSSTTHPSPSTSASGKPFAADPFPSSQGPCCSSDTVDSSAEPPETEAAAAAQPDSAAIQAVEEDLQPDRKRRKTGCSEAESSQKVTPKDAFMEKGKAGGPKTDKMEESLTCIICQDLLHDCVSLQPCMHTFCAACYSNWMERSSFCPTCRCPVERICKNHILNNLVEAYLQQHPEKCRSEEDLQCMDKRNRITQDMLQPKVERWFSDEEGSSDYLMELSDVDSESSDISQPFVVCRQCPGFRKDPSLCPAVSGLEAEQGEFKQAGEAPSTSTDTPTVVQEYTCPPHGSHVICTCCFQPMPDRRAEVASPQPALQQCTVCQRPFCHVYWGCTRVGCLGCLARFCDLNLTDKCLDGVLNNNNYESDILKNYLVSRGVTWKEMLKESLVSLQQGVFYLSDYRITGNAVLCYCCGLRSFRELAYQYRQNIPAAELPAPVTSRPDCYWGRNCRTQVKAHHAMKFNHICEQTRFKN